MTDRYAYALQNSEITLSPLGTAAECFRTFEAIELGSVPLIEDKVTGVGCRKPLVPLEYQNTTAPYRLFKLMAAPLTYIKSWNRGDGFVSFVRSFEALSDVQRAHVRLDIFRWYGDFKRRMKTKLIGDVKRFFR